MKAESVFEKKETNINASFIAQIIHDPTDDDHLFILDRSGHIMRWNMLSSRSMPFVGARGRGMIHLQALLTPLERRVCA